MGYPLICELESLGDPFGSAEPGHWFAIVVSTLYCYLIDKADLAFRSMTKYGVKNRKIETIEQPPFYERVRRFLFDSEHDHYQLVNVGWQKERRVYGCVLHLDLKHDKVWIQHNTTEVEIAEELMALGVPKEDIVIGFHLPYKRRLTEFAVA